jgi:hypothetical protein
MSSLPPADSPRPLPAAFSSGPCEAGGEGVVPALVERPTERLQRQRRWLLRWLAVVVLFVPPPIFAILVRTSSAELVTLLTCFSLLALLQLLVASAAEIWVNQGYLLSGKVMFWASLVFFHAAGATAPVVRAVVSPEGLLAGAVWCLVGIAAACAGGLFVPVEQSARLRRSLPSPQAVTLGALAFLAGGTLSFIPFLNWWGWKRFFSKYTAAFTATALGEGLIFPHWYSLTFLLWPFGIWLAAMGWFEFRRPIHRLLGILAGLVMLVPAIVGARGEFFTTLLILLLIRHKRRPFPNWIVGLTAVLIVGSFGPLGIWRIGRSQALAQSPYGALLRESLQVGAQLRVVGGVMEFFPAIYDYSWGRSYLAQFVGKLIPIVGWQLVQDMPLHDVLPAVWITWIMNVRRYPYLTTRDVSVVVAGWGYSMIAEAFQNFGGLGVLVLLGLFGALVGLLDRWFLASGVAGELIAGLLISDFLMGPRQSSGLILDRAVIGTLAAAAFWLFVQLTAKKGVGEAGAAQTEPGGAGLPEPVK